MRLSRAWRPRASLRDEASGMTAKERPAHLRSPVGVAMATCTVNRHFAGSAAWPYESVLQAGTAAALMAGHSGPEWPAYFGIANYAKRSAISDGPGDASELIAGSSVILENWGARRAERWGLSPDSLRPTYRGPLIRLPGFGRSGPLASYRAYSYNITAHSGLLSLITAGPDTPPRFDLAAADLVTAYWNRDLSGRVGARPRSGGSGDVHRRGCIDGGTSHRSAQRNARARQW
jgi:hypothetical protein